MSAEHIARAPQRRVPAINNEELGIAVAGRVGGRGGGRTINLFAAHTLAAPAPAAWIKLNHERSE